MSAPHSGRLSARDIVLAAIALIDVDGLGSLTMRKLGSALDVEAMALYRYYPSRVALLDAVVEHVVNDVAGDPQSQLRPDDDWRDYLDRIAHGVRRMALAHPRVFPLVASHPTEAPWIRPPIRSLSWVDAMLEGLQDHHFPPPAAVAVYKRFSTFLLGHLLLEVAALGLEFPSGVTTPRPAKDVDKDRAEAARRRHAHQAEQAMADGDGPTAEEILDADPAPRSVAEEPAVQAAAEQIKTQADPVAEGGVEAVRAAVDVPITAAVVSTETVDLSGYPHVASMAGLLAQDTAGRDFEDALDALLDDVASLRRP